MINAILSVLGAALSLWDTKDKQKYVDQMLSLKNDYYKEIEKPDSERDDAVIDDLEFQIQTLAQTFASEVAAQVKSGT